MCTLGRGQRAGQEAQEVDSPKHTTSGDAEPVCLELLPPQLRGPTNDLGNLFLICLEKSGPWPWEAPNQLQVSDSTASVYLEQSTMGK